MPFPVDGLVFAPVCVRLPGVGAFVAQAGPPVATVRPVEAAIAEDTLTRYRRVLGEDHPVTLRLANNLAVGLRGLGEYEQARDVDKDTLSRYRRVLGEDHPATLDSANNLAADLRALGEHEEARELHEDTLARRRRVLGDDHPATLRSAHNLAADLRVLGEHDQAGQLDEWIKFLDRS